MKIGNTSINLEALQTITKEQFIEMNRGRIMDIEIEAKKLSKYFKQEVATEKEPYQKKKRNKK